MFKVERNVRREEETGVRGKKIAVMAWERDCRKRIKEVIQRKKRGGWHDEKAE